MREQWQPPLSDSRNEVYDPAPICFVQAADLSREIGDCHSIEKATAIIRKVRNCPVGIAWKQGWTPKEHLEMELLRQQAESQRQFQEEQRERDRQFRSEQKRKDRLFQIGLAVLAAFAGLAGVLVGAALK